MDIKQDKRFKELVNYYLTEWAGEGWKYEPEMESLSLPDCFHDTLYMTEETFLELEEAEILDIKEELENVVYNKAKAEWEKLQEEEVA